MTPSAASAPTSQFTRATRQIKSALVPIAALVLAIFVTSALLLIIGADPIQALQAIVVGSLGSSNNIGSMVAKTTPLLLAGVGIAFALRAGLYNIGAEGQIYVGALFTTVVVLGVGVTGPMALVLGIAAGAVGGAVWCGVAGYLKAERGVNEVITTLLLNYVAIQLVLWAVSGPLKEPGATFPRSADLPAGALLPALIPGTQGHMGIVLALILAVVARWVLRHTTLGFKVRALESGPATPRYAGMAVNRLTTGVMAVSGALAGVAGAVEVAGVHRRLIEGFSPGYGFDAIAVALVARANPLAVIPAAFFFGILRSGATAMQRATGVPSSMVFVVQAVTVLFLVGGLAIQRMRARQRDKDVVDVSDDVLLADEPAELEVR